MSLLLCIVHSRNVTILRNQDAIGPLPIFVLHESSHSSCKRSLMSDHPIANDQTLQSAQTVTVIILGGLNTHPPRINGTPRLSQLAPSVESGSLSQQRPHTRSMRTPDWTLTTLVCHTNLLLLAHSTGITIIFVFRR